MLVKHSALRCLLCCGVLSWVFHAMAFFMAEVLESEEAPSKIRWSLETSVSAVELLHSLWLLPSHKGCWDLFINNALRQWAWIAWSNRYRGRKAICVCFSNAREHHHFWHLEQYRLAFGLTCIIPNLCIKSVSYENDLFLRLYRDWMNKWGLDGPRVTETLFAWHLAAFVPPDLVRPISQFVSFAAALSGDPGVSGRLAGFADYDYGFCSRTRGIFPKTHENPRPIWKRKRCRATCVAWRISVTAIIATVSGSYDPKVITPRSLIFTARRSKLKKWKENRTGSKTWGCWNCQHVFVCAEGSLGHVGTWVILCVCLSYFLKWLFFGTTFVGFVTRPWILITYTDTCRTSDHLLYLLLMSSVCCNNVR